MMYELGLAMREGDVLRELLTGMWGMRKCPGFLGTTATVVVGWSIVSTD